MSGVAAEAGVSRLTLYRHFESPGALFEACIQHWAVTNPPPDVASWLAVGDFEERLRRALRDLYEWFDEHGEELFPLYRDTAFIPPSAQAGRQAIAEGIAALVLSAYPTERAPSPALRATMVHVVGFWTWRSLADAGLSSGQAAELAASLVLSQAALMPISGNPKSDWSATSRTD